ncbi:MULTISPECIES: DUF2867 domain-containing protein [unclassified Ornithinimicrobium]|uniref:DUF2867 domain-containing protein n=1 Tax=unclassified Ornithinimicrobium TaxID=2615080 RepID=UPI00385435C8
MSLTPEADGVFRERRERTVEAPASTAWSCVADLGGEPGWYAVSWLWQVRGVLDRAIGGPGNRGRPTRELCPGDPVDGWRVEALDPGRSLTLVSEQRLPGTARLTHEVESLGTGPDSPRSRLVQRLEWHPDGRPGRVFWRVELPMHKAVMSAMVTGMAREAERRALGGRPGGAGGRMAP